MAGWMWVLIWVLLGVAAAAIVYVLVIRPWHMNWGSSREERRRSLPGDDLVGQPVAEATHAVTIAAPAAQIWPWIIQIGQGRAGFYSYDWLERLFGFQIRNADRIVPELQRLNIGDGVLLHQDSTPMSVVIADPNHALVLACGRDLQHGMPVDRSLLKLHTCRGITWAFVLDERPDKSTRLLVRVRAAWDRGLAHFFRSRLFLEPAHSIMQRGMNVGIKQLVEAHPNP